MNSPPIHRARRGMQRCAAALAVATAATTAPAQSLTFAAQNSQHTCYCGAPGSGPLIQHSFQTAAATSDFIAVSDPGSPGVTPSNAASQADAMLLPAAISIAIAGNSARGPLTGFGVYAAAAGREEWTIDLTATTHFTLNVALSAASSEPSTMPPLSFFVLAQGAGASITPDPGSAPTPYAFALTAPGSYALTASGTMTAGRYVVSLAGRAEGMSYPFDGAYAGSVTLGIGSTAAVTTRNAGANPTSYSCTLPILGQTWQGTVDLTTTGHDSAALFGALAPALVPLPSGQTILLAGPLLALGPIASGPTATFSIPLPASAALAGFVLATQAIHFGTAPDFVLSNANDLTLGF